MTNSLFETTNENCLLISGIPTVLLIDHVKIVHLFVIKTDEIGISPAFLSWWVMSDNSTVITGLARNWHFSGFSFMVNDNWHFSGFSFMVSDNSTFTWCMLYIPICGCLSGLQHIKTKHIHTTQSDVQCGLPRSLAELKKVSCFLIFILNHPNKFFI